MTLAFNKRIVLGLGMIVFVAAVVVGGTGAFFSDTEVSTGNTFTAGAIDLRIDSEQHYNGNTCVEDSNSSTGYSWSGNASYPAAGTECTGTWALKDLDDDSVTGDRFFDFYDLKPGDYGENTISLHIESNDAYLCAALDNVGEADNGQNEPEALDDLDGDTGAELDENLHFFAWVDEGATSGFQGTSTDATEGDNVYQDGEPVLGYAYADELDDVTWGLVEGGDSPVVAGETAYIGVAWCMGTFDGPGPFNCNGSNVSNAPQTDSWYTDIAFYVEQARNNDGFSCDGVFDDPNNA